MDSNATSPSKCHCTQFWHKVSGSRCRTHSVLLRSRLLHRQLKWTNNGTVNYYTRPMDFLFSPFFSLPVRSVQTNELGHKILARPRLAVSGAENVSNCRRITLDVFNRLNWNSERLKKKRFWVVKQTYSIVCVQFERASSVLTIHKLLNPRLCLVSQEKDTMSW